MINGVTREEQFLLCNYYMKSKKESLLLWTSRIWAIELSLADVVYRILHDEHTINLPVGIESGLITRGYQARGYTALLILIDGGYKFSARLNGR